VIAGGNAPSGGVNGFGGGDFQAVFENDGTVGGGFGNKAGTDNANPNDAPFATVAGGVFNRNGSAWLAPRHRPKLACGIGVNFNRERSEFFAQPCARLNSRLGKRDTLRAVFVGGEAAQFLEFSDGAFGIYIAHGVRSELVVAQRKLTFNLRKGQRVSRVKMRK
jgi:hypothetical protein